MSKFKALGSWVAVETGGLKKEEKVTEQGVIYKESQLDNGLVVWSVVNSIGPDVVLDIKVGDSVLWKLGTNDGAHYKDSKITLDLVPEDAILAVEDAT
tara:strand:- start:990 stop:1283 length:294 start_codon:yes stop_codon:yes gene_type:complete